MSKSTGWSPVLFLYSFPLLCIFYILLLFDFEMVKKGETNVLDEACAVSDYVYEDFVDKSGWLGPFDLVLPCSGALANNPLNGCSALYLNAVVDGNLQIPLTSFFSAIWRFYGVGFSQLHHRGVLCVVAFEMLVVCMICRAIGSHVSVLFV